MEKAVFSLLCRLLLVLSCGLQMVCGQNNESILDQIETKSDKPNQSKTQKPVAYYDSILQQTTFESRPNLFVRALLGKASLYTEQADFSSSHILYSRALGYIQKLEDPQLEAKTLVQKAHVASKIYLSQTALSDYLAAERMYVDMRDSLGMLTPLLNLGYLYLERKQTDEARSYFERVQSIAKQNSDTKTFLRGTLELCRCELEEAKIKNQHTDTALAYLCFKNLLRQIEQNEEISTKTTLSANARIGLQQSSTAINAAGVAKEMLEILPSLTTEDFENSDLLFRYYTSLGQIFLDQNESIKAGVYLQKAKTRKPTFLEPYEPYYVATIQYYTAIGELNKALQAQEELATKKEAHLLRKQKSHIRELSALYETQKRSKDLVQKQIDIQEKARSELEMQNRLTFILFVMGFLALAFSVGMLYLRQKRGFKEKEIEKIRTQNELHRLDALMEGEERERKRVAHILHEEINSEISALKYKLSGIPRRLLPENEHEEIRDIMQVLDASIDKVRQISVGVSSSELEELPFVEAVENYVNHMNGSLQANITFQYFGILSIFPRNTTVLLVRILKELLQNAILHAASSQILVQMYFGDEALQITVEDDGLGFDAHERNFGLGLQNTIARINYLRGDWDIVSDEKGTSIDLSFSYEDLNRM